MTEKQKKWSQIEKIMYIKSVAFKGWFKCDTFSYILRLEFFSIFLPMNLYHGSNAVIEAPNLEHSRKELDFGIGFYTTANYEQAEQFSEKVVERKGGNKIVNIYDFDNENLQKLKILKFAEPNGEWLNFVSDNRNSIPLQNDYDIIIGPVANDDVFRTLLLYFAGELSVNETLDRLKIKRLFNQYVFKNENVLKQLIFVRAKFVE